MYNYIINIDNMIYNTYTIYIYKYKSLSVTP